MIPCWDWVITRQLCAKLHMSAQNSKCRHRFREIGPDLFAHVFYESLPSHWRFLGGGLPVTLHVLEPKYPKNKRRKTHFVFGEKKKKIEEKKRRTVTGWQGFIEHVCQISGSYLHKKRRGHWNGNGLAGVHIIEHVCEISGSFISTKRRGHCMRIRFWVDVAWTSLYTEWSSCRRPPPKNGFWDISESLIPRSTIPWHRCITNTTVKHYYGRT